MYDDKDNNLMMNDQIYDDGICDNSFSMMVMMIKILVDKIVS
jgi:hypothetical protein